MPALVIPAGAHLGNLRVWRGITFVVFSAAKAFDARSDFVADDRSEMISPLTGATATSRIISPSTQSVHSHRGGNERSAHTSLPPPAKRIELPASFFQFFKGRQFGAQLNQNFFQRPDLILMSIEPDIESRPGVRVF
jgi:hypothetical protein